MRFDPTLSLGVVVQILAMLGLAVAVFNAMSSRMTIFENSLKSHAERLDKHEDTILELLRKMERLIGWSEHRVAEHDRRERDED